MTVVRKGDWGYTDEPLEDTQKFSTGAIRLVGADRFYGTLIADQNCKLRVKQGIDANNLDYIQEIAIVANVSYLLDVAAVGIFGELEIENDSGADMTVMHFGWKITI